MEKHGIALEDEHPDLVLVGFDTTLDYAKMTRVCDLVREGLPYIATHPDFNCPTETGFIPDSGAIAHVAVKLRVNGVYTLCAFDNCKACAARLHTRPVDFPLIA